MALSMTDPDASKARPSSVALVCAWSVGATGCAAASRARPMVNEGPIEGVQA